jgi:hypothetical protein
MSLKNRFADFKKFVVSSRNGWIIISSLRSHLRYGSNAEGRLDKRNTPPFATELEKSFIKNFLGNFTEHRPPKAFMKGYVHGWAENHASGEKLILPRQIDPEPLRHLGQSSVFWQNHVNTLTAYNRTVGITNLATSAVRPAYKISSKFRPHEHDEDYTAYSEGYEAGQNYHRRVERLRQKGDRNYILFVLLTNWPHIDKNTYATRRELFDDIPALYFAREVQFAAFEKICKDIHLNLRGRGRPRVHKE